MARDLDDFLRRAAQRRQAKAAEQRQAQQPERRVRPQYSDARTERIARPVEEAEEVLMAEVVDDPAVVLVFLALLWIGALWLTCARQILTIRRDRIFEGNGWR